MSAKSALISFAISFGVLVVGLAIVEALKRRGIDPVGRIADLANARPAAPPPAAQ